MSDIKIYFNKNSKKLEERVKLKKLFLSPKYSFGHRYIRTFKYPNFPGPGNYDPKTNNKSIYTFDGNRGVRFAFKSIFEKLYKKSPKKSDRLYKNLEEKLRYNERKYLERVRQKEKHKYKPNFTSYDRFKNLAKIDYDKYKSVYL